MSKSNNLLSGAVLLALAAVPAAALAAPAGYALTADQKLVFFKDNGGVMTETVRGTISGFGVGDSALVGIDFRPADGKLYGLGNGGGVYTIELGSGALTAAGSLSVPLSGTAFDMDFNPVADRLRIVSDAGQSLRHQIGGATAVDGSLNYTGTLTPGATVTTIGGAGYTNNDVNAESGTALFVLDAANDQVAIVSPPNTGVMVATGKFGLDVTEVNGFDIRSAPVATGTTNRGYAALTVSGVKGLYLVDFLDGSITGLADFSLDVVDVAFRPVP